MLNDDQSEKRPRKRFYTQVSQQTVGPITRGRQKWQDAKAEESKSDDELSDQWNSDDELSDQWNSDDVLEAGQLILDDEEITESKVSVKAANQVDNVEHQGKSEQRGAQGGPAAPAR